MKEYNQNVNRRIKKFKNRLYEQLTKNKETRKLRPEELTQNNLISVFESVLTRTLGIQTDSISEDIIVVQTYFFNILEDLILNGFYLKNEKYICFTASAGQIRTKKTVFIKESVYIKHHKTLMCGLDVEKINQSGGVNINKYLAYLALCNSATEEWYDFDISKTIVVEDMTTLVNTTVDFIDDSTYQITRKEMDIPIEHTDGCGMILPRKSKKAMMVRLPWVKGLLVPFPFDKFIRENGGSKVSVVKDIYGQEHDIIKEKIEIIFTKSQFKMWKYYKDWQDYKDNFIFYDCRAGKCNEEEDRIGNAKLNYQILQTLTDITQEELFKLSTDTIRDIRNIGTDKNTMLKTLGVTNYNKNKNYFQQALNIYPELLNDTYSKEVLKQVKKSLVKQAKAGKLNIDGKYTFISPDLYAFCEFLFLGIKKPKGLLDQDQVYCSLFKDKEELDCLRSPHLYREHAIRKNCNTAKIKRWFVSKSLYTSVNDPISKVLMFDNDGDKALVCNDSTLVEVAKRNMQGIVPLYYEMKKAGVTQINSKTIYEGLNAAYTGGNIGIISNDITKIWNNENVDLDVIKLLCMENNFVIDYAKTLYKPERPDLIRKRILKLVNSKAPYFFIYAKDKEPKQVEEANDSTMNRLAKIIPNPRISFKKIGIREFDYRMLLSAQRDIKLDETVINTYNHLDLNKRFMMNSDEDETSEDLLIYKKIREKIIAKTQLDLNEITDVLIEYLYNYKNSNHKTTLWSAFGDVIVKNIKGNISRFGGNHFNCVKCGCSIEYHNKKKYCNICAEDIRRKYVADKVRQHRKKRVNK